MHAGRLEEASALSLRIGRDIVCHSRTMLCAVDPRRGVAEIWRRVNAIIKPTSFSQAHVPSQWKTSIIFPIPKIASPSSPADFRLVSITPVLYRLLERIIVRTSSLPLSYFHQLISLSDQFAFCPTDSLRL